MHGEVFGRIFFLATLRSEIRGGKIWPEAQREFVSSLLFLTLASLKWSVLQLPSEEGKTASYFLMEETNLILRGFQSKIDFHHLWNVHSYSN